MLVCQAWKISIKTWGREILREWYLDSGPANLRFSFTSRFLPFSKGRLDRTALRKPHLPSWSDPSSLLHSIFSCQKVLSEKEEGWKASCEKIFQDVHVEFCETWMKSDVKLKNFNVKTHAITVCYEQFLLKTQVLS